MPKQTTKALDLYAKVEDLLGVNEAAPKLYAHYLLFLQTIEFDTLLDVGCGSGNFLNQMQNALNIDVAKGIDLSPLMVSKSLDIGMDVECINLCDVKEKYDVITAVFDMLNYLNDVELSIFLKCVKEHLNEGGYLLCDINTLYGFENVAVGTYVVDDNMRFLSIDSDFEELEYHSEFTLFEKKDEHFVKSQETIMQYYHEVAKIVKDSELTLLVDDDVFLYADEYADKTFLVLQKR